MVISPGEPEETLAEEGSASWGICLCQLSNCYRPGGPPVEESLRRATCLVGFLGGPPMRESQEGLPVSLCEFGRLAHVILALQLFVRVSGAV